MALVSVDYFSAALMCNVTFTAILPIGGEDDAFAVDDQLRCARPAAEAYPYPPARAPLKTLVLLHGVTGNSADWLCGTRVRELAERLGIAVIMPSGNNSFYLDQAATHNHYGQFVGAELVAVARRMFPLSARREDTFIGGLSMGGYGALRNGLRYAETFGAIMAFSAAVVTGGLDRGFAEAPFYRRREFMEDIFGPLDAVVGTDKDPVHLARQLVEAGQPCPRVYLACGTEDGLVGPNRTLADQLTGLGLDVTHREAPGGHTWDYWSTTLPQGMEWLVA